MLGVKSQRKPIVGEAAREIRETAKRITTGKLNSEDVAELQKSKKRLSHYNLVWE